jgi:hypothetical protein
VTATRTRSALAAPRRGLRYWYALFAGIALWMLHLSILAALVRLSCTEPAARWAMHAVTAVTAAGTGLALWWSAGILLQGASARSEHAEPRDDRARVEVDRDRFLGAFGLFVGGLSLLIILWEASYVLLLDPCRGLG